MRVATANRKIATQAINHARSLISTIGPSLNEREDGNASLTSGGAGKDIGRTESPFVRLITSGFLRWRCFVVTVLNSAHLVSGKDSLVVRAQHSP